MATYNNLEDFFDKTCWRRSYTDLNSASPNSSKEITYKHNFLRTNETKNHVGLSCLLSSPLDKVLNMGVLDELSTLFLSSFGNLNFRSQKITKEAWDNEITPDLDNEGIVDETYDLSATTLSAKSKLISENGLALAENDRELDLLHAIDISNSSLASHSVIEPIDPHLLDDVSEIYSIDQSAVDFFIQTIENSFSETEKQAILEKFRTL